VSGPVLVEVTRGGLVESRHRGSVVVVDADGGIVLALGDIEQAVVPRSAVKALQALPLVASGASDALGFDERALTLACASHTGEPGHVEHVASTLAGFGATVDDLACGPHWPAGPEAARALAAAGGEPTAVHNNCSGKHTGFLALAVHTGAPKAGYTAPDHPVQVEARTAIEAVCGVTLGPPVVDGCSAPTWPLPLRRLAHGFARFGAGVGLAAEHAEAARRLRDAVADHPWHVGGTERLDSELMAVTGRRAFVKVGAEGVYAASLPELGLGAALKVDDGGLRAAEVSVATVLQQFLDDLDLGRFVQPPVRSWRGDVVGAVRPGPAWTDLPS
jgi:L-asparaginase II